jgi:hypothetical protein
MNAVGQGKELDESFAPLGVDRVLRPLDDFHDRSQEITHVGVPPTRQCRVEQSREVAVGGGNGFKLEHVGNGRRALGLAMSRPLLKLGAAAG